MPKHNAGSCWGLEGVPLVVHGRHLFHPEGASSGLRLFLSILSLAWLCPVFAALQCVAFSLQPMVVASLLPMTTSSLVPLLLRVAIGLPVVLASKTVGKEVGKVVWPAVLTAMGLPLRSQKYVRALRIDEGSQQGPEGEGKGQGTAPSKKAMLGEDAIDVDIMIRLTQYGALSYSVKGLVPLVFKVLRV